MSAPLTLAPPLLNRALWLRQDKPGLHLIMTLAREFRTATRDELEAVEIEVKTAMDRATRAINDLCTEAYGTSCEALARDRVRALLPWIDEANLDRLVGVAIVNYYR